LKVTDVALHLLIHFPIMKHFVTIDVGGTKVLGAACTEDGQILARSKEKTERGSNSSALTQIERVIGNVLQAASLKPEEIGGYALGVPGVVDTATGHVVSTPNAPLSDTPLGNIVSERWGAPALINNDVNLGVLGEYWKGAAKGSESAYGIFVGTGIGGGLVLDGKLIEGFRSLGGEIGNLIVPLDADEIAGMLTKKHTHLEDLCSRTAIENQLRHAILREGKKSILTEIVGDKKLERIRSKALKEALKRGDALVTDVLKRASFLLGLTTCSVLHIVDPEYIVFGGGVIEACGDFMLPLIEKTARKVAMPGTGKPLHIVRSALGDDAINLGGVALLRAANLPDKAAKAKPAADKKIVDETRPRAEVDKPLGS
jgi:glucokinase